MKKVSVIVPCYNQSEFLSEALNSVLSQTYTNWECVIINDGSSDDTEKVAIEYCERDERFKYILQNNQGVSAARNNGIKESCGYYILPLDGDDVIEPTYIELAIRHFEEYPDTTLVYCKADFFGAKIGSWWLPEYNYKSMIWNNCIFVSALYKREDFDKTHGYNVNMDKGLEDWDFWLSLLDANSVVYRIDDVLFHYRIKEQSRNVYATDNIDILRRQIFVNHRNIYDAHVCDIIKYHNDNLALKKALDYEERRAKQILSSVAYRIGSLVLKPFKILKKLFK